MTISHRPVIVIKKMVNSKKFSIKINSLKKGKLLYQHFATTTKLNASKRFLDKIGRIDTTTLLKNNFPASLPSIVFDYYEYLEAFFLI